MSNITKVLVIRFSSIGDVVLTTPVVRCLKKQLHGESEIHFLIKDQFSSVLDGNPYIDKVHRLKKSNSEMIDLLKEENFHYIIDLHNNLRSHLFRKKLKVLAFTFPKLNIQKWLLVNFKIDLLPDVHIVERYFEATKALGIENDNQGLDYFIPQNEKIDVEEYYGRKPNDYICFAIGGAHEGKKLPVQRIKELCQIIEHSIILIGGKEDQSNGDEIARDLENVTNSCGKHSIHGSASIIDQSRMLISHDSGMMHIGAALNKKIISIWGATVPKFGMYPYMSDESVIIEADHLKFRPTSKLGNKNSSKERRTMEEIDLQKIKNGSGPNVVIILPERKEL